MKKLLFVIAWILIAFSLYSQMPVYSAKHTMYWHSAADMAMGGTGCANIYNSNPISMLMNPAKLGFSSGLAFGWGNDLMGEYFNNQEQKIITSLVTFGYRGAGIMFPNINNKDDVGITVEQHIWDPWGEDFLDRNYKENMMPFGIGFNVIEFAGNFMKEKSPKLPFDIALGMTLLSNDVPDYFFYGTWVGDAGKYDEDKLQINYGLLINLDVLSLAGYENTTKYLGINLTGGKTFYNPAKTYKKVQNPFINDMDIRNAYMPYGDATAGMARLELKSRILEKLTGKESEGLKVFSTLAPNLLTLSFTHDHTELYDTLGFHGYGLEIKVLDMVSFRSGKYSGKHNPFRGDTGGWGLDVNFMGYVWLKYDRAEYHHIPVDIINDIPMDTRDITKEDFAVIIDPFKIWNALKQ